MFMNKISTLNCIKSNFAQTPDDDTAVSKRLLCKQKICATEWNSSEAFIINWKYNMNQNVKINNYAQMKLKSWEIN